MEERKLNLVDAALAVVFLALLAALAVQLFLPNPLRTAVVDDAERPYVEATVESAAGFLRERMNRGDRQVGEHDRVEAELLSFDVGGKLRSVWKVRAREWRESLQFGPYTLKPGGWIEIHTREYVLAGHVVEVRR